VSVIVIIPARHASSRLPGKPLLKHTGKYLIQHVYERALQAKLPSQVIVATDDPRIESAVRRFKGNVMMTRRDHASGTDRVAEVARKVPGDLIINLQGDEPMIDPAALDLLISLLQNSSAKMATLATPLSSLEAWRNPNCVKVVLDDCGDALYFSRSPIPYVRDATPDLKSGRFLQHVGMYGYRREFLLEYAATPPGALEKLEKLEQLRALAMGATIRVGTIAQSTLGVDTRDDYDRFVEVYRAMHEASRAA
jgi:3-deoxy-manno-octulosonate cytidylyltransferase (CMP-KDO synthetase)